MPSSTGSSQTRALLYERAHDRSPARAVVESAARELVDLFMSY